MNIDETIQYFEEIADGQTKQGKCPECVSDHRQLAEWLTELKDYKERMPCDDAVSRQAAIDAFERFIHEIGIKDEPYNYGEMALSTKNVPPVSPQLRTGHWIQTNEFFINQEGQFVYEFICSECNCISYFRKSDKKAIDANVCPNCGAKQRIFENHTAKEND